VIGFLAEIIIIFLTIMNYLVTVLIDRIQAEEAYTMLEKQGLPMEKVTILGKGYQSADEFGLIDPNDMAIRQSKGMAIWLIPFGFLGGIAFSLATGLQTFAWAGEAGNHIVGGLLGSIGGAMGSVFVGGGTGALLGSGDALPYRNRLNAGKYIVVVQGSALTIQQATKTMRGFNPESMQNYTDPDDM
jgi:hypothetical protein